MALRLIDVCLDKTAYWGCPCGPAVDSITFLRTINHDRCPPRLSNAQLVVLAPTTSCTDTVGTIALAREPCDFSMCTPSSCGNFIRVISRATQLLHTGGAKKRRRPL